MKNRGSRVHQGIKSKIDRGEIVRLLDVASEVRRLPFEVIQGAFNYELTFGDRPFPSEKISKKNPPISLTDRTEEIVIDGTLGFYDSTTKTITIFSKAINRAAEILGVSAIDLTQIVRLHEYAHALLHLGVDKAARRSLMPGDSLSAEHVDRMDSWFKALDPNLHEALAQLLVREGLRWLKDKATIPDAQASIDRLQEVFRRLMQRAPSAYQIDKFDSIEKGRIFGGIRLLKNGGLVGADAWETVVTW
jgi:hypothetical protein